MRPKLHIPTMKYFYAIMRRPPMCVLQMLWINKNTNTIVVLLFFYSFRLSYLFCDQSSNIAQGAWPLLQSIKKNCFALYLYRKNTFVDAHQYRHLSHCVCFQLEQKKKQKNYQRGYNMCCHVEHESVSNWMFISHAMCRMLWNEVQLIQQLHFIGNNKVELLIKLTFFSRAPAFHLSLVLRRKHLSRLITTMHTLASLAVGSDGRSTCHHFPVFLFHTFVRKRPLFSEFASCCPATLSPTHSVNIGRPPSKCIVQLVETRIGFFRALL